MTTETRKRPEELGQLLTAFENRRTMQIFVSIVARESEVWIAEDPEHADTFRRDLGMSNVEVRMWN